MTAVTVTGWRKASASASNGHCLEAGSYRKASASGYNGSCVEAGTCRHGVAVRDTKDRNGPVLKISATGWAGFLAAVRCGTVVP